jgi:hypothetical protein
MLRDGVLRNYIILLRKYSVETNIKRCREDMANKIILKNLKVVHKVINPTFLIAVDGTDDNVQK